MFGLIGINLGMTSLFSKNGENIPCTIIKVGPCYVIQVKTMEKDGYSSIQLGIIDKKEKHTTKALQGHFRKSGVFPKKKLLEFKDVLIPSIKLGSQININSFVEGELVDVRGITKGKGFQGVVKRHKFSGVGERSHGQHNRLRAPGSVGAGSDPSRIFKGKKMAGRMGGKHVTIKNLTILKIDVTENIFILNGSVPGNRNSYLMIKKKKWN
ncbi:large subunit ribosomal protein L3 [Blattabacterium sp. (Blatta orientalis) str. Tarazona]|uniref:50S ribosomal protein L3 n=1 Tax=Blattabacterium sp. (Blatta orientalis) TaxID=367806 RepID=UPI0002AD60DE|nr:50S ribosomal protein L3 [Blattabacterium sp. (Blatta orientalis)]AGD98139.1 large subunit ribosomal protein L3 [Blattabacterium sp. (Blatta orientalis) str. Tarazona]